MDVGGIINAIGSNVSSTLPSNIPTIKETVGNDGVAVDITNKGPGTYVLQFDDSSFSRNGNQGFNINKNADQNIIIYCTSTSLEIDDYQINGVQMVNYVADTNPSADGIINSVIFYGPNATSVKIGSSNSTAGVFIFPNATITKDKTCAGILVANSYNSKGGEWHYHNHHLVSPTNRPKTKTSVSVKKEWDDSNNKDGKRPDSVTVHLFADGEDTNKTVELNADNNWNGSFTDLDSKKSGKAITYTVQEDKVDGYDTSISGDAKSGFVLTNSHKTETVNISGTKTWADNDNQDGARPDSITIRLMADGKEIQKQEVKADKDGNWTYAFNDLPKYANGQEITYTVSEDAVKDYTTTQKGNDFTNTHKVGKTSVSVKKIWKDNNNQDGIRPEKITVELLANGEKTDKTLTLDEKNNWSGSFTNLDAKKKGKAIAYSVAEVSVPKGYTSEISGNATEGYIINNTHKTETVDISGTKTWKDNDNQDGKRPDKITVTLMANGEDVQSKEIAGDWTYAFNNLPKYDNGKEIKYTIKEDKVAGYTSEVKGYDLINTHKIEKTSVSVKKEWDDTKNQDGKRPTEVTVHLYADGKDTSKAVTLSAKNDWKASFNDLDVNKDGKAIEYTVKEDEVKDYETSTSGDAKSGFVLTNSHKTETVNISGTKTWADNDNQDGARPDSITIRLMADGKEIQKQEVKADKDGNWTYAFNDLPKYANGQEITYTVSEDAVKDYTTTQKGNDFTNTHKVGKTSVSVKKIWKDNNNQDGIRPEKITVELLANGEKTDKTLTLDEKNNWSGSFTDLDAKKKGKDIQYSIAEVSVPKGYKSIITGDATKGYIVTNTHTTHKTTTGKKTNHTSGTNTGMKTNVRFYSLSTIVSLLAIAFFRRRFVK